MFLSWASAVRKNMDHGRFSRCSGGSRVTVDGSEHSLRAVKHFVRLGARGEPMQIHLLNVQPPVVSGHILIYVTQELIEAVRSEQAAADTADARALLDHAGIPYVLHVGEGDVAEVIARYVHDNQCDAIIMGTRGMGTIRNLTLGSVATKVIHLVDIPVTLVK